MTDNDHRQRAKDLIEEMGKDLTDCPNCSLPMYRGDGDTRYCPSCEQTYTKGGKVHLPKVGKRVPIPLLATTILVASLLLMGGGFILLYRNVQNDQKVAFESVADVRGLDPIRDVDVISMGRSEYFDLVGDRLDTDRLWQMERLYECLMIMDTYWDLADLEVESTAEGPVCFYDDISGDIYLMDQDVSRTVEELNTCREYVHALQDQHYNLSSTGSFDRDLALSCIREGDALFTMERWADKELDLIQRSSLDMDQVIYDMWMREITLLEYQNYVLGEISLFPYKGGEDFVERVHEGGGWEHVNKLFTEKPPLSTEHILHFDKYLQYEEPLQVENDVDIQGMELIFETTVGEKLLLEMMPKLGSNRVKNISGIGWGGDTFSYLSNDTSFLSIFTTEWDTLDQNTRFHSELSTYLQWKGLYRVNDIFANVVEHVALISSGNTTTMYLSDNRSIIDALT
ncbi:MAG: hypothetical protein KAH57_00225 [Thermoplasmata archaeon]|nr:hypothetical protein [Thermoplasmata archaeon]